MVRRREFIGSLAALGGLAAFPAFAVPHGAADGRGRRLRFGAISDPHVTTFGRDAKEIVAGNLDYIRKAMDWYRGQRIDALMCCGDIADNGDVGELQAFAKVWYDVFPDERLPDGSHVEKLFIYGNHDSVGFHYGGYKMKKYASDAERQANGIFYDHAGVWKRTFHDDYAPIWMKTVKGYAFIGQNWDEPDDRLHGWHYYDHPRLGPFLEKHGVALADAKPFFYFQHPNLKDTCFGATVWGHDRGHATSVLEKYPNAVAFSGHSHYSNTNERSVWQGAFTSIGVSSLRYTGMPGELREDGYENATVERNGPKYDPYKVMPSIGGDGPGHQGLLVDVYDDRIVVVRRDFTFDLPLGDDWVIPVGNPAVRPFAFATRAAKTLPPEFPDGAVLAVERVTVRNRGGKGKDGKLVPALDRPGCQVLIPVALGRKGARPYEYEVTAESADGKKKAKRVIAVGYSLPLSTSRAMQPSTCRFAFDELDAPIVAFTITPFDSYGTAGKPLVWKGSIS